MREFPGLSTVPLIRNKIKKLCCPTEKGLEEIIALKSLVSKRVDGRIPVDGLVMEASLFDPIVVGHDATKDEAMELMKGLFQKWKKSRYWSVISIYGFSS